MSAMSTDIQRGVPASTNTQEATYADDNRDGKNIFLFCKKLYGDFRKHHMRLDYSLCKLSGRLPHPKVLDERYANRRFAELEADEKLGVSGLPGRGEARRQPAI